MIVRHFKCGSFLLSFVGIRNMNFILCSCFRKLAKLDKKDDERITAYFEEFSAMCRRVCNQSTPEDLETKRGDVVL